MTSFAEHPLLAGLEPAAVQQLLAAVRERRLPAGTTLLREGDPGDGLYILQEGTVEISLPGASPGARMLAELGPGAVFGEMAILEEKPRSAAAVARTEVRVWFVPREAVLGAIRQSPELGLRLLRELSRRLREFNRVYVEQTLQMERLALLGRFARGIIHDLKSPLNVIQLAAEMGLHPSASEERRTQARERIRRQVERITDSINEILLFTEGGSGAETFAPTPYGPFLESVLEELATETTLRGVSLAYAAGTFPQTPVRLQPRRLRRVLQNLVHNACDVLAAGGRIEVRAARRDDQVVTEVRDNGPGIAPEIRDRLFEPFATHGKAQGTGLGLSICRRIVEDHGGVIEAENAPEGGAVFRFWLPVWKVGDSAEKSGS
ncbi:MAG: ATP-binding protein [Limisphaera sp.]